MKDRITMTIDPLLRKIITEKAREKHINISDLIALSVANELEITLSKDYTISPEEYKEYQIKCIDNKMQELTLKKQKIIKGEVN